MGREIRIYNNLTRKQLSFVSRILKGDSGIQAALFSYNTTNAKVAASIAYENLTKPDIRKAIEEALNLNGLSLSRIVSNIGTLATSNPTKISGDTKLKANIELIKLMNAATYSEKDTSRNSKEDISYEEAKRQFNDLAKQRL